MTPPPGSLDLDRLWRMLALATLGYTLVLRFGYAAGVEMLPEETYYWNYARHLDFGYLDHPPMVAWIIKAGTLLFGDTSFGVRFGALCCGLATTAFVFRLTQNVFGETAALVSIVLAQSLPFFFLSGVLMTPDAPLTAAWSATLYFLERALVGGRSAAWLYAGLFLGLGLLSKYTIGVLAVAALLFLVVDQPARRWLTRWEPYAAAALAAAVFSPVIVWNARHDWASFAFQTSRRLAERPRFSLHKLLGGALVLITPVGFGAVVAGLRRGAGGRAGVLLRLALLVPLAIFLVFSLRHEVKLDWTGAPWVAALPLLSCGWVESGGAPRGARSRWLRFAWPPTIALVLLTFGACWIYLVPGIPGAGYPSQMELVPAAWREFGRQVNAMADDLRNKYGDSLLVVGMDRYAIASEVAFYSPDHERSVASTSTSHLFEGVGLMYEQWFPARLQAGRPMLLIAWNRESLDTSLLREHLLLLEPIQEGTLMHDGWVVRHYYFRIAHGYLPEK